MLLFLFACATKSITGLVHSTDGKPLSEASITINNTDTETKTNANGEFVLEPIKLKKGTYTLMVTHDDFVFAEEELFVSGKAVQVPLIKLQPIEVSIPYLPINLDPNPPKKKR